MNKPLTLLGVDRALFFLAAGAAGGTFNFFGSLLGGLLMFVSLYLLARWATRKDPQMLRILFGAQGARSRYDVLKASGLDERWPL